MEVGATLIARYRVEKIFRHTGMADWWLARDLRLNRWVAIKTHLPYLFNTSDADPWVVFQQDASTIEEIEHPYILPIYNYGKHQGMLYIVTRYVNAGTLSDRLAKGPMTLQEIVQIGAKIAEALDYAHANDLVHHELKPSSIWMDRHGTPYIADFLRAIIVDGYGQVQIPDEDTLFYTAPERLESDSDDHRSDLYSFCVMLFEMITGTLPFDGQVQLAYWQLELQEQLPDLVQIIPDLPPQLTHILRQGTSIKSEQRQSSATEIINQLRNALGYDVPEEQSVSLESPIKKRKIFISYRKTDQDIVHPIAKHIQTWDNVESVWIDTELEGGQLWWDMILEEIRNADLIIVALSDDYLDSVPCQREYDYALELGKVMLPIQVRKQLDFNRLRKHLSEKQAVKLTENTPMNFEELYQAINRQDDSPPLPIHMPKPPPVPLSELVKVEELISKTPLSEAVADKVFGLLFEIIMMNKGTEAERDSAFSVIHNLLKRPDISHRFAKKLQQLLKAK